MDFVAVASEIRPRDVHAPQQASRRAAAPSHATRSSFPGESARVLAGVSVLAASQSRRRQVARGAVAAASRPTVEEWMVKPMESKDLIAQSRPAHWVLRTTDVKANLRFFTRTFGMKVLRHEEFEKPCAITCNGEFETPWSKTMIGYGPEDEGYCLELTYNYGVDSYEAGTGLAHIAVAVEDPKASLREAESMGYTVEDDIITGPDSYKFRVLAKKDQDASPFQYVALKVKDLDNALRFYRDTCGMDEEAELPDCPLFTEGSAKVVRYPQQLPLALFVDKDAAPKITQWEGRHAIAVPGKALRAIYKRIMDGNGKSGKILHHIREFNELPALRRMRGLPPMACSPTPEEHLANLRRNPVTPPRELESGTLAVAIVKDVDGYEICLVSAETFNQAVRLAYKPDAKIDWQWRGEAMAGRRSPTPDFMVACI